MAQTGQSVEVQKTERKAGELGFSTLAILFGAAGYYFALDMTSGELSSPSVAPKMASIIIMIMGTISLFKAITKKKAIKVTPSILFSYLFSRDVLVILVLLAAYSVALPTLHFPVASFLFLVIALVYLQNFKKIPMCLGIAAGMLAMLIAIFTYIFKVQLP